MRIPTVVIPLTFNVTALAAPVIVTAVPVIILSVLATPVKVDPSP